MEIIEATSHHSEVLVDIICKAFRDVAERFGLTEQNCPKHPSNCTLEWISKDLKRGVKYYLMVDSNNPIGCVAMEMTADRVAYLRRLAVLPSSRRKGFGALLVKHVLEQAKEIGADKVSVGIIAKHAELNAWYQELGFVENGTKSFSHLPFHVGFLVHTLSGKGDPKA